MTDISVIKMIISVAVWRIYPSWVNDKLRAWEGLGHSGMFWARLSRDDFRSKLEIISFLSRVMSVLKSFFCFPHFWKIWRQTFKLWGFWFRRCLGGLFENSAPSLGLFCELRLRPQVFFEISFLFSKAEPVLLARQLWRSPGWAMTLVMVRRKLDRKLDFRALARTSAGPSIVVTISTSRVPWSVVQKRKKHHKESQRVIARRLNPSPSTKKRVLKSLFPRPDVATVRTSLFSWM